MKRCIYCGRENKDQNENCQYCGESLSQSDYGYEEAPEVEVVDEGPKKEQRNQTIRCPRCDSEKIYLLTRESSGFDGSNACCGYVLFGPLGLLCGLATDRESETTRKCRNCGYEF